MKQEEKKEPYFIKAWMFKLDEIAPAFGVFPSKIAAKELQLCTRLLRKYTVAPVYISETPPVAEPTDGETK